MGTRSLESGFVRASFGATIKNTLSNGCEAFANLSHDVSQRFDDGDNASQFNRAWSVREIALPDGGAVEYDMLDFSGTDLGAGDGNDAIGQPMDLDSVVMLAVVNSKESAGIINLSSGTALANGLAWLPNQTPIEPGGHLMFYAPGDNGFAISPTESKFKLDAVGEVIYSVFVFGRGV